MIQKILMDVLLDGTSGEKLTLDYHSRFPTGPIQSSTQPVYHTPKNEIYGPTPVPIPVKKGNHLQIKRSPSQNKHRGLPAPSMAKDMVHLAHSSSIQIQISPLYLGHNPRWAGTGHPRDAPPLVLMFGGVHLNIV